MEKNILFELSRIKCELVYLNNPKKKKEANKMTKLLKTNFTEIYLDEEPKDSIPYLFNFYEQNQIYHNMLMLTGLYFVFLDKEITTLKNYILQFHNFQRITQNDSNKKLSKLIIIGDNEIDFSEEIKNEENIIILKLKEEQKLKESLSEIIINILKKYISFIKSKPKFLKGNSLKKVNLTEVKITCEEYIQIKIYDIPKISFGLLVNEFKIPTEQTKFKEFKVISIFLEDYQKSKISKTELNDNKEIYDLFEIIFNGYKKAKQQDLLIESYLRLITYESNFKNKLDDILDLCNKCNKEVKNLIPHSKYKTYIYLYQLLNKLNLQRISVFYLYLALHSCYEDPELASIIPYVFLELDKIIEIYDITENEINSYEKFNLFHKIYIKYLFKPIGFYTIERNEKNLLKASDNYLKRIEKEYSLYIRKRLNNLNKKLLIMKWPPLQYNIFQNLLNFYKTIVNQSLEISNYLCLIQTLNNFISENEQKNIFKIIQLNSNALQEKLLLNLIKLPILIRLIPLCSKIKFDFNKTLNIVKNDEDEVFIYNPWDKNNIANFYWSENSIQEILVEFYNELNIEIILTKIDLLIENNEKIIFCFPSNAHILPKKYTKIIFKIKPLKTTKIKIIGLKYEIFNIYTIQYVDERGNGMFFNLNNKTIDTKENINLNNIQIYPELPYLKLDILNDNLSYAKFLELYEYEKFTFEFQIENFSNEKISDFDIMVYAFKKDDYKICLEELNIISDKIKVPSNFINNNIVYNYKYNYLHRKGYRKFEIRFYFNCESISQKKVKPYLCYEIKLKSKKLFKFSNLKNKPINIETSIESISKTYLKNKIQNLKGNYKYCFIANEFFISLDIELYNPIKNNIDYEIININDKIPFKKGKIVGNKNLTYNISLNVNKKLNKNILRWYIKNQNKEGSISFFNIVINELNYRFNQNFEFNINKKYIEENLYYLIEYTIKNCTKDIYKNLEILIVLYQKVENKYLINENINPNIFYEGKLNEKIKEFIPNEIKTLTIKLYPYLKEECNTSIILLDHYHKIIYMSSFSEKI